jgi:ATP synthase protein I
MTAATASVRTAMAQQRPPAAGPDDEPKGDPWHAFGYIVAGVVVYGLVGWLLDRWLGTEFLVAIGILAGAGLGIYMTYARFNKQA